MQPSLASELGSAIGRCWAKWLPFAVTVALIQKQPLPVIVLALLSMAVVSGLLVTGYVLLRAVFRQQHPGDLSRSLIASGQLDQRQ